MMLKIPEPNYCYKPC